MHFLIYIAVLFPIQTNLFFIIDVGIYKDYVRNILSQLFDGINLLKYRLSTYTTNGVYKKIVDFQSRECTIKSVVR